MRGGRRERVEILMSLGVGEMGALPGAYLERTDRQAVHLQSLNPQQAEQKGTVDLATKQHYIDRHRGQRSV